MALHRRGRQILEVNKNRTVVAVAGFVLLFPLATLIATLFLSVLHIVNFPQQSRWGMAYLMALVNGIIPVILSTVFMSSLNRGLLISLGIVTGGTVLVHLASNETFILALSNALSPTFATLIYFGIVSVVLKALKREA